MIFGTCGINSPSVSSCFCTGAKGENPAYCAINPAIKAIVISLTLSKIPPLKKPASVVVDDLAVEVSERKIFCYKFHWDASEGMRVVNHN